ncbi:hypothetical protein Tco_1036978 [Tanacetum coccineum]
MSCSGDEHSSDTSSHIERESKERGIEICRYISWLVVRKRRDWIERVEWRRRSVEGRCVRRDERLSLNCGDDVGGGLDWVDVGDILKISEVCECVVGVVTKSRVSSRREGQQASGVVCVRESGVCVRNQLKSAFLVESRRVVGCVVYCIVTCIFCRKRLEERRLLSRDTEKWNELCQRAPGD